MLIIAQPKSASTSLVKTISKICRMNYYVGISRKNHNVDCEGFKRIQTFHNNMVKRNEQFINNVTTSKAGIFKEHLLPTEHHLKLLEERKQNIVILLRNPEHSTDSYLRFFKKETKRIINKEFEENVLNDLIEFNTKYKEWSEKKKYVLIIDYDDLILNYKQTITKILRHYGIKKFKIIPLLKYKYTEVGSKRLKK